MPIALGNKGLLAPGRLLWLRALGWMLLSAALLLFVLRFVIRAVRWLAPATSPPAGLVLGFVAVLVAVTTYTLLVRAGEKRWPQEMAPARAPIELAAGLGLGALMFSLVMALLLGFGIDTISWTGPAPAWRAGSMAIQSAVVEEIVFRGLVLRLLWRAFGPAVAFIASAALFGLAHMFNPGATLSSAACIALEAGIPLAALFALTGRLWVPIGLHAAWNFTQAFLFGAAVSGTEAGPALARTMAVPGVGDLLSGGRFGPEASLPAVLVCCAVGIPALLLARRSGRFDTRPPVSPPVSSSVVPASGRIG